MIPGNNLVIVQDNSLAIANGPLTLKAVRRPKPLHFRVYCKLAFPLRDKCNHNLAHQPE